MDGYCTGWIVRPIRAGLGQLEWHIVDMLLGMLAERVCEYLLVALLKQ